MGEPPLYVVKGRRRGGDKAPTPKEYDIHVALVALLRRSTMPQWIWTHLGHGERRDPVTAARLKKMGVIPGFPDFVFIGPGRVFFLELKREGGRASEAQRDVATHIMACRHGYLMTSDLDDAIGTLRDLGIVRASVSA